MGNANGGGICAGSRELSAEEELDDAALLTEMSIDDDIPGRKLSEKEFAEDLKKSLTGSLFSKHQEVDNMINSGNDQGLEMKSETQEESIKKRNEIEYWKNVNISLNDARDWTRPRGMTKLYDTAVADINRLRSKVGCM